MFAKSQPHNDLEESETFWKFFFCIIINLRWKGITTPEKYGKEQLKKQLLVQTDHYWKSKMLNLK